VHAAGDVAIPVPTVKRQDAVDRWTETKRGRGAAIRIVREAGRICVSAATRLKRSTFGIFPRLH
jgi:hypothetical protein